MSEVAAAIPVETVHATAVTFHVEPFETIYDEGAELLKRHWAEIAFYPDIPLEIDHAKYAAIQAAGNLRCFTARKDGALIGYAVFILGCHLHYAGSLMASQDVLYIAPEHRRGRTGIRLIQFSEDWLRNEDVQLITQHVKLAHPALGALCDRLGYEAQDVIYSKRLDR